MAEFRLNPVRQQLLWSMFGAWVGAANLRLYQSLDWREATAHVHNPAVSYPDYYTQPAFHGIAGGYLTEVAAVTYDPVTAIASPPNEMWLRRQLLAAVASTP